MEVLILIGSSVVLTGGVAAILVVAGRKEQD